MRRLRKRALKLVTEGRASLRREWHTLLLTGGVCALVPVFALSVLALPPGAVEDIAGPVLGHSSIAAQLEEETGASRIRPAGAGSFGAGEGSSPFTAWTAAGAVSFDAPSAGDSKGAVGAREGGGSGHLPEADDGAASSSPDTPDGPHGPPPQPPANGDSGSGASGGGGGPSSEDPDGPDSGPAGVPGDDGSGATTGSGGPRDDDGPAGQRPGSYERHRRNRGRHRRRREPRRQQRQQRRRQRQPFRRQRRREHRRQ